ncbi:hypothetical protein LJC58_06460 [Lachnospiraceae bacterium OttesenSCG-928-D06]|nr:hypothetical protein [Lachnospiraceae bacterium OttesenSCG-928-D06]
MNLSMFLNSVDTLSGTMENKQLVSFIHDIARVLPESRRDDFLSRMRKCTGFADYEKEYDKTEQRQYEELKEKLDQIESWEICLLGELNEEYDDWYHDVDEFLFSDPEGIGKIIESACEYIHEAIDKQIFDKGNEIAEILIGLKVMVGGEYQDYVSEPLELEELEQYDLANIDYKKLVVESLYISYCANELEERADALYRMIHNANTRDISLEMVMQCGEELPELQEFLPKWIEYLGKQSTYIAQVLLNEAINLRNNPDDLLESARTYYEQHPDLYRKYICENQDTLSYKQLIAIGREALEKINKKYVVRSKIALQLADITLADKGKVTEDVEQYWLEAFRSDSRVVNYLRMMMECCDFSVWKEELQKINHSNLKQSKGANSYGYMNARDLKENIPDYNQVYLIGLLNGEYKFVRERGMNYKDALGWSASFMKNGLAACLVLFYNGENLAEGIKPMLTKIVSAVSFSAEEYGKTTLRKQNTNDCELLWECFKQSKVQNPIPERELQSYLKWIEQLVKKRVDGIMEGNYRKYYGECAAYIAGLGEVLESRGTFNGKQNLMLDYKQCYSRRSAFHEALRNFGMRDKKK